LIERGFDELARFRRFAGNGKGAEKGVLCDWGDAGRSGRGFAGAGFGDVPLRSLRPSASGKCGGEASRKNFAKNRFMPRSSI